MLIKDGLYLFEDVFIIDGNFDGWIVNESDFAAIVYPSKSWLFEGLN